MDKKLEINWTSLFKQKNCKEETTWCSNSTTETVQKREQMKKSRMQRTTCWTTPIAGLVQRQKWTTIIGIQRTTLKTGARTRTLSKRKWEPKIGTCGTITKLSEEREHYWCNDRQQKTEYEQMVAKN